MQVIEVLFLLTKDLNMKLYNKISRVYFLLPLSLTLLLFSSSGFTDTTPDKSNIDENKVINHSWGFKDCPGDYMTPEELDNSIKDHEITILSDNVKKKVLNKKHHWDKLITITGDTDKDFNSVNTLLEKSKDTSWSGWKLIQSPRCFPEADPVVIRCDYITTINEYKVRTIFTTYIATKEAFLVDAWVVAK